MAYIHIQQEDKAIKKKFADLIPKSIKDASKEVAKQERAIEQTVQPVIEKIVTNLEANQSPSGFDDRATIPSMKQQKKNLRNYENPEFWSRAYETGTIAFATGAAIIAGPATAGAVGATMAVGLLRAVGVELP